MDITAVPSKNSDLYSIGNKESLLKVPICSGQFNRRRWLSSEPVATTRLPPFLGAKTALCLKVFRKNSSLEHAITKMERRGQDIICGDIVSIF
jgi:hypothetical protein